MAKFSRYDPRNKKRDRNKIRSMEKDIRIKEERGSFRSSWYEPDDEDHDEYEEYKEYIR